MEDVDRANEAMEADAVGAAAVAAVERGEQHHDDESDSSSDEDEDDSDEDMDNSDSEDDDDEEEEEEQEEPIPTPEEVELEYTFPQDFVGRSWEDVVQRRYFRLIFDPACLEILREKFRGCKYLIEIVYPEGTESQLLRIGSSAFEYCCNLQRMNPLPEGLVDLGYCAFYECRKLQGRITIPSSIQFVRGSCFAHCESITSVVFDDPSISTTPTVVYLQHDVFWYCDELRFVRLPNNLTDIPSNCFYGCSLLSDVPIPGTVRTIQFCAFTNCGALRAVDLPESVIDIEQHAYDGCSSLLRVTIRSSTNAIQLGRKVFRACPSLATIRVVNPLVWSRVLSAMNYDPSFIYKFVRKYEGQIMTHRRSSR